MSSRELKFPTQNSFFLFGPRQTGKTFLLREALEEQSTIFYNLLLSEEYMRLSANPALLREEVLRRPKVKTHPPSHAQRPRR